MCTGGRCPAGSLGFPLGALGRDRASDVSGGLSLRLRLVLKPSRSSRSRRAPSVLFTCWAKTTKSRLASRPQQSPMSRSPPRIRLFAVLVPRAGRVPVDSRLRIDPSSRATKRPRRLPQCLASSSRRRAHRRARTRCRLLELVRCAAREAALYLLRSSPAHCGAFLASVPHVCICLILHEYLPASTALHSAKAAPTDASDCPTPSTSVLAPSPPPLRVRRPLCAPFESRRHIHASQPSTGAQQHALRTPRAAWGRQRRASKRAAASTCLIMIVQRSARPYTVHDASRGVCVFIIVVLRRYRATRVW